MEREHSFGTVSKGSGFLQRIKMKESQKTLWLIPARGGSKGIPDKNIKPFCGKPLVCRSVEQAMECKAAEDVVFVSTDSEKIRSIAEKCNIRIPFLRPLEFATDTASTYDVIMHAIREFESKGIHFDKVVLLQPTSPLRTVEDIKKTVSLWNPDIDMAVTVCVAKTNPYYNAFETDEQGFLTISKGDGSYTRRQDAPHVWEYNGAVYVMTVTSLKKGPISSFKRIIPSPMPAERSLDLDTRLDWQIAETLFQPH